jgi:hypothetical protein
LAPAVGGDPPAVRFAPSAFAHDPAGTRDQIDGLWARLDLHGVAGGVVGGVAAGPPAGDGLDVAAQSPEILLRADADLARAAQVVGEWVAGTDLTMDSSESN